MCDLYLCQWKLRHFSHGLQDPDPMFALPRFHNRRHMLIDLLGLSPIESVDLGGSSSPANVTLNHHIDLTWTFGGS